MNTSEDGSSIEKKKITIRGQSVMYVMLLHDSQP